MALLPLNNNKIKIVTARNVNSNFIKEEPREVVLHSKMQIKSH